MRICLFTTYFPPDVAATGVISSQIGRGLSELRNDVSVVTTVPHYDRNRIWEEYRGRLSILEEWSGISVRRLYTFVPARKGSFGGRLLNYGVFTTLASLFGLFGGRPDAVLAVSPPLTLGVSADFVSRIRRIPFVYMVHDIWPDVVVRAGQLRNPGLIRFFEWLETYIYRRAAAVTVLSDQMKENLVEKGVSSEKVHVIPTCQDTDFVRPGSKLNRFSREQSLVEQCVVLFAGNVGHSQGLETVLEAAKLLADERTIQFLIVGDGVAKPDLEASVRNMALDNVRFLPYQPHERVPEIYASSDICLVPLKEGFTTESVPSKVHTIMAAGRPIVASVDAGSATSDLIEEAECGLRVAVEDPAALAEAIRRLEGDPQLRKELGRKGREYVVEHFTPEIVARQYDELLRRVVSGSRG